MRRKLFLEEARRKPGLTDEFLDLVRKELAEFLDLVQNGPMQFLDLVRKKLGEFLDLVGGRTDAKADV